MLAGSMKSPIVGSSFAVWGGLYATFDCSLIYLRHGKEDSWNPILSGALTGGALSMRSGWRSCATNAFIGGLLLVYLHLIPPYHTPWDLGANARGRISDLQTFEAK
ncbi:mitochondrial import inner membrane translocase subunit [Cystoisospora suis]|uniref:Mitochondrial import inner membrane translocase subunit n=1 Tax=Cystoisospora suis TaxID=483139 RepID=A0A2C6KE76_9APIC|nr:mitochondrial import inner membrane translocase subunit [Cystoisospora suis]